MFTQDAEPVVQSDNDKASSGCQHLALSQVRIRLIKLETKSRHHADSADDSTDANKINKT